MKTDNKLSVNTYRIVIRGLVQGVGFRPFIYRTAMSMNLMGSVENRNDGVTVMINATDKQISDFIDTVKKSAPPASSIQEINFSKLPFCEFDDFQIVKSTSVSSAITEVSPDIAVCQDCLDDMKSQSNRIDYPFINCTNCGPRFTIIEDLPYDREKTSMKVFKMCTECMNEYNDVLDRRFHAQPVACEVCGPHYTLHFQGKYTSDPQEVFSNLASMISDGKIVAVKGMGGFFIACDAFNEETVSRLRASKNREGKPFALMFRDIETLREYTYVDELEQRSLLSLKRPIVLLRQKKDVAPSVNTGFSTLGAMMPYMPLHYLLFERSDLIAIVLTSGNISDEPIIIDNDKALKTLGATCDAVLVYNRDIHNRSDDSVVTVINGSERVLRRSRGYSPIPVKTLFSVDGILATGAELVNCFCIGKDHQAIMSQHIGDLKNLETYEFFCESIERHKKLFRFNPMYVVADLHPDYYSTRYAEDLGLPVISVQHHHAHIASCMGEHGLTEPVIGIAFDGTGLGDDGNIWGGEFLICDMKSYNRIAHLEYLPLPGGDRVTYEPWRTAVSMLYKLYGDKTPELDLPFMEDIERGKLQMIVSALKQNINTPLSSGAGRYFDGVSALIKLCTKSRFHAEAPMRLENIIAPDENGRYDFQLGPVLSFKPVTEQILMDLSNRVPNETISARFHNTIIEMIIQSAQKISDETGLRSVVLSGGTFQNRYLSEKLEVLLSSSNFKVYAHSQIPANDGGLALGQLLIGATRIGRI
jgi:hydrogenase maturation protein HypF